MRQSTYRVAVAVLGLLTISLTILGAQARAQDASRETIIQGVRDDVRRKIQQEESERSAGSLAVRQHGHGWTWHHSPPPSGR
jgi:hypothetical protein